MSDFRQLKVWQKAHALTLSVYRVTGTFPKSEMYGLTSQLRRASVSVGSNLAEGTGRGSKRQFVYFIQIASGSVHEVQYQLTLARDLGWLSSSDYPVLEGAAREVRAMLDGLRKSLEGGRDH